MISAKMEHGGIRFVRCQGSEESSQDSRLASGLIVSNHSGRQFDGAPAAFHRLAPVRTAAPKSCVMFDSGVRTGTDVMRSFMQSAEMTWIERPSCMH